MSACFAPFKEESPLWPTLAIKINNTLASSVNLWHSCSVFNSPLMLVKKPHADPLKPLSEQYRIEHNYVELNKNISPCSYPFRHLYELLDDIASGTVFQCVTYHKYFSNSTWSILWKTPLLAFPALDNSCTAGHDFIPSLLPTSTGFCLGENQQGVCIHRWWSSVSQQSWAKSGEIQRSIQTVPLARLEDKTFKIPVRCSKDYLSGI